MRPSDGWAAEKARQTAVALWCEALDELADEDVSRSRSERPLKIDQEADRAKAARNWAEAMRELADIHAALATEDEDDRVCGQDRPPQD